MTIIARKRSYVRLKAYLYSPSQKPNFDDFEMNVSFKIEILVSLKWPKLQI